MTPTAERIYLFLAWWIKAYGYAPPKTTIAERCQCSDLQVESWLNKLASRGYIKLYNYNDGSYNVKIMLDPTRPWQAVLQVDEHGRLKSLTSELPIQLHVWRGKSFIPDVIVSERDLMKQELKKKGII